MEDISNTGGKIYYYYASRQPFRTTNYTPCLLPFPETSVRFVLLMFPCSPSLPLFLPIFRPLLSIHSSSLLSFLSIPLSCFLFLNYSFAILPFHAFLFSHSPFLQLLSFLPLSYIPATASWHNRQGRRVSPSPITLETDQRVSPQTSSGKGSRVLGAAGGTWRFAMEIFQAIVLPRLSFWLMGCKKGLTRVLRNRS